MEGDGMNFDDIKLDNMKEMPTLDNWDIAQIWGWFIIATFSLFVFVVQQNLFWGILAILCYMFVYFIHAKYRTKVDIYFREKFIQALGLSTMMATRISENFKRLIDMSIETAKEKTDDTQPPDNRL